MFSYDIIIMIFSCTQPILIGFLTIIGFGRLSAFDKYFLLNNDLQNKSLYVRIYECSTISKLNNLFNVDINVFILVISYLIYDVDLIFFFSETVFIFTLSWFELFFLSILILLLIIGLFFDFNKNSTSWKF